MYWNSKLNYILSAIIDKIDFGYDEQIIINANNVTTLQDACKKYREGKIEGDKTNG